MPATVPLELPIVAAVLCAIAVTFAVRAQLARKRYARLKMSGGRKALVRNLFGG